VVSAPEKSWEGEMNMRNCFAALLMFGVIAVSTLAFGAGPSIRVGGDVQHPMTFDVAALEQLPVTHENVTYFAAGSVVSQTFTGVLLWDLLQSVGIIVNPMIKNDILRKTVVVIGSDGYEVVFGVGEIDPNFGGHQIMVAYAVNGQPLGVDGPARIVAPGDKEGGRFVSNIVKIEVRMGAK
jgi:hypothetical protein